MKKIICTTLAVAVMAASFPTMANAEVNREYFAQTKEIAVSENKNSISTLALTDNVMTQGYFTYYVEDGEGATIVKCDTAASGTVKVPETLGGEKVTTIGTSAFYECTAITDIELPSSVTTISTSAFAGCTSLTNMELPEGIEKIGYYAFDGCSGLKMVVIPQSVSSIGEKPFRACSSLETINVNSANAQYSTKNGVLYNKNATKIIDYPSGKTENEFTLPSTVTEIGNYAFYGSEKLIILNIPDSVTKIGEQAIRECKKLQTVNMGSGVATLGNTVLSACPSLITINVSANNSTYASKDGALYSKDMKTLYCVGGGISGTFNIPNTVETVLGMSMASCKKIAEIAVPGSVRTIEANAFRDCDSLTDITVDANNNYYCSVDGVLFNNAKTILICFPGGLKGAYEIPAGTVRVENYAFYSNHGLTSIDLPVTVKEIGNYAFMGAEALQTAFFFGPVPTSCGDRAFENTDPGFAIYYMPEYRNSWAEDGRVVWNGYPIYELTKVGTDSNGFEFLVADGYARIKSYSGSGGSVTIPAKIEGYPVSMLYEGLFTAREDITNVTIENGITTIPRDTFFACTALEVVVIPSTVTTIGENAFRDCRSLTTATLPGGLVEIPAGAFCGCSSLTRVTVPRTVKSIGSEAFYGCNMLRTVTIGAATETIGAYAFASCQSLTEVSIGSGVSSLGNGAFAKCPNLVEAGFDAMPPAQLGEGIFAYSSDNFVVSCFEEYMQYFDTLGNGTWYGYKLKLRDRVYEGFVYYEKEDSTIGIKGYRGENTALSVPSGINGVAVTTIDAGAFENLEGIVSIVIPDSVTSIGANAFAYCTSLYEVTVGKGVTAIGDRAFDGCNSLAAIYVAEGNNSYSSDGGALYDASKTKLILFPDAYTGNFVVPSSVKTIAPYAFDNCTKLTFVKLPEGLMSIGENAFSMCTSLSAIVIPSTVTELGSNAFRNCSNLEAACFKGEAPAEFGDGVFTGVSVTFTIRYLSNNAQSWKSQGGISYKGYDIAEFSEFPEIVLAENSTCKINGAYLVNIPIKTIVVELSLLEMTSNGIRVVNTEGVAQSDYSVICTGYRVQLVHSGVVVDELSAAVVGDINGDGNISSRDIALIQRSVSGGTVLSGAYFKAADISGDGNVNSRDIALLQRQILGM
ncbi:MAG: leucine-rich repeat protein [Clostridia bacterium]|nr:leucine-rich repeat protein [Clostridia bacterium]